MINKDNVIGPMYVVLNITNKCNLKCLHCFNGSPEYSESFELSDMPDNLILKIIDDLIDLRVANVCFSGGEPFMRKKLLFKCLYKLSISGIRTSIVTNGTLINKYNAELLKVLGVKEVQISIDGSCADFHERMRNVKGCFEKAVKAIKYLKMYGITTSVSLTTNKWNIYDIDKVCELVQQLSIKNLNIRPLLILGEAKKNELISPKTKEYRYLAQTVKRLQEKMYNLKIEINDPINHIYYYRKANINTVIEIQNNGYVYLSYCIPKSLCDLKYTNLKDAWHKYLKNGWKIKEISSIANSIYCLDDLKKIKV